MAVTGGGSQAISQLLEVPGGAQTLLEAVVPYSQAALKNWLGGVPDQACSEPTARAMAMAAWVRARALAPEADPKRLVGLGATASLATSQPKRGEHRVHVAVQTAIQTVSYSLPLVKAKRERCQEQELTAKLMLLALGNAYGVDTKAAERALADQLGDDEPIELCQQQAEASWTELLLGQCRCVAVGSKSLKPKLVFPGAFNPPHNGHREMARVAQSMLATPLAYELSITNVEKPPLDFIAISQRLDALASLDCSAAVLLTGASTFLEKARLFPGCTFMVGADTVLRIADARFYDGGAARRDTALEELATLGCRLLVFGRQLGGRFQVLADLALPEKLQALCDEVTAEQFRKDVSSTDLRH